MNGHQARIAEEITDERDRQDSKWGPNQKHPDVHPDAQQGSPFSACFFVALPTEEEIKKEVDEQAQFGETSWSGIATEELVEAVCASTTEDRRKELVQLAAVVMAWIEDIDSRSHS